MAGVSLYLKSMLGSVSVWFGYENFGLEWRTSSIGLERIFESGELHCVKKCFVL